MNKPSRKEILAFIKVIRESFHDSMLVYRYGGCYGFHQILKHVFPQAIAYYEDKDKDHIISKIGNRFYDIGGETDCTVCKDHSKETAAPIKLTNEDHEHWRDVASGQRLEFMIAKYERSVNQCKK